MWASHGDFVKTRAAGLCGHGDERQRAGRRDGGRRAAALRAAVPSRSRAHRSRHSRSCATSPSTSAAARGDWTMASFVDEATARIRAQVGDGRVVCGLSGGVDSTVAALLDPPRDRRSADVHLRRQRRACATTRRRRSRRASSGCSCRWCSSMRRSCSSSGSPGITDPEQKRKIIGATFIDVFEAEADEAGHVRLPRAGHALSRRHRERVGRSGRRTSSRAITTSAACPSA